MQDPQCQGQIGSGPHGKPQVGLVCQGVAHGPDVDDLHALALPPKAPFDAAAVDCGVFGVGAPGNQQLGLIQLGWRHVVRHAVGLAAQHRIHRHLALREADGAVQVVGAPMDVEQPSTQKGERREHLRGKDAEGFGPVEPFLFQKGVRDGAERFFPAYPGELRARSLGADPARGVEDPARSFDGFVRRHALGAERGRSVLPVVTGIGAAFGFRPDSVFDMATQIAMALAGCAGLAPAP